MRTHIAPLVLIVIVTGGVFANALGAVYLWDDNKIIVENAQIRDPARAIRAFGLGYWRHIRTEEEGPAAARHYRPVVELSFALDYAIHRVNRIGCHLTNIVIHAVNSMLVYLLAYRVLRRRLAAAFCGLLFAVHPLHVEAVAWAKCRAELLALLLMLASLLLYLRWMESSSRLRAAASYAGSLGAFALALGAKASAGVLPLLVVLYGLCLMDRPRLRRALGGLLPFVGVAIAFLALYAAVWSKPEDAYIVTSYQRLLTSIATMGAYVRLLVLPTGMCLVHDFVIPTSVADRHVLWELLWVATALAGSVIALRRSRPALFALVWLLAATLPVSVAPETLRRLIADSRAYVPSVGFCLLVAVLLQGVPALSSMPSMRRALRTASAVMGSLLLVAYAGLTIERNADWSDQARLFADTVAKNPTFVPLRVDLASLYIRRGDLEAAIPHLREAVALQPDHTGALRNLARACRYTGRYEEAIRWYKRVMEQQPSDAEIRIGLGKAYVGAGRYPEAIEAFQAALHLEPQSAEARSELASLYMRLARWKDAVAELNRAIQNDPSDPGLHHALGAARAGMNEPRLAVRAYRVCLRLQPGNVEALLDLGEAYEQLGLTADAARSYRECMRLGGPAAEEAGMRLDALLANEPATPHPKP